MSRYIDVDELKKRLGITSYSCAECDLGMWYGCTKGGYFVQVCLEIEKMPVIEINEKENDYVQENDKI